MLLIIPYNAGLLCFVYVNNIMTPIFVKKHWWFDFSDVFVPTMYSVYNFKLNNGSIEHSSSKIVKHIFVNSFLTL